MPSLSSRYEQLLQQYIDICNRALSQNKHIFPYNHLSKAVDAAAPVTVVLVDDVPKGLFELSIDNHTIQAKDISNMTPTTQVVRLNMSEIERIVENPNDHINDPTKIDWRWLRT